MCTYRIAEFKEKGKRKEISSDPMFAHVNQAPFH